MATMPHATLLWDARPLLTGLDTFKYRPMVVVAPFSIMEDTIPIVLPIQFLPMPALPKNIVSDVHPNVGKQCDKPPMTGNDKHTTYESGGLWDGLLFLPTLFIVPLMFPLTAYISP